MSNNETNTAENLTRLAVRAVLEHCKKFGAVKFSYRDLDYIDQDDKTVMTDTLALSKAICCYFDMWVGVLDENGNELTSIYFVPGNYEPETVVCDHYITHFTNKVFEGEQWEALMTKLSGYGSRIPN